MVRAAGNLGLNWANVGLFVVHVGTNDVDNGDGAHVLSQMQILVQEIHAWNPNITIIIVGILPRPKDFVLTNSVIQRINRVLKLWCSTRQYLHFYHAYRAYLYHSNLRKDIVWYA